MNFELIIGLEIHLKLNSPNKLFCLCANEQEFDTLKANTHICPVCTGQPGALPVLNKEPLEKAIQLGLSLGCQIQEVSRFDRKSYFYPDLPMGYQITQQYEPTCIHGKVSFYLDKEFTQTAEIHIENAHIETDTGKTIHTERGTVLLDYNRAGTPLVEIVTAPDFRSSDEVVAFLKELQRRARYQGISDAEMEKGQMRCDVNISLREKGEKSYRTRVEMKNMSSFSAVRRAIEHEYKRQAKIYEEGGEVFQETRGWDDASSSSYIMRSKEDAMDYRYMPDPDLPPVVLDKEYIESIKKTVVELPYKRIKRYKEQYAFNKEYINGLIGDVAVNNYFEKCVADGYDPKLVAKWIVGPVARWLSEKELRAKSEELRRGKIGNLRDEKGIGKANIQKVQNRSDKKDQKEEYRDDSLGHSIGEGKKNIGDIHHLETILPFTYQQFCDFLKLQEEGTLISQHAKTVMKEMLETGKDPQDIIEEKGLKPVDEEQVKIWLEEIFAEKPELLDDLKSGNMKLMGFVVGQVMRRSGGAADPTIVNMLLKEMIAKS